MLLQARRTDCLRELRIRIHAARSVTAALMADVLTLVRNQGSAPRGAPVQRIRALIEAEAWTDAVLAVLEVELPQWKLRHLVQEDGEWRCCLGKQHLLPDWLDDIAEVSHPVLPLAILDALIKAHLLALGSEEAPCGSVPSVRLAAGDAAPLCCDNFV
jgi:hypothetical protein